MDIGGKALYASPPVGHDKFVEATGTAASRTVTYNRKASTPMERGQFEDFLEMRV